MFVPVLLAVGLVALVLKKKAKAKNDRIKKTETKANDAENERKTPAPKATSPECPPSPAGPLFLPHSSDVARSPSLGPASPFPGALRGRQLGEGTFGKVFEVEGGHAIKVPQCEDDTQWDCAKKEFRCMPLGSRKSPNVLQAHKLEKFGPQGFLRMDCCEGDLRRFFVGIKNSTTMAQREALALHMLRQMAHALAAVHGLGIVYADMKPDNILVSAFPSPGATCFAPDALKLIDFGLSFLTSKADQLPGAKGRLYYMAPEMRKHTRSRTPGTSLPSPACDMYGLGVIARELIIQGGDGLPFFTQETLKEDLSGVHPFTRTLINGLLEREPSLRLTAEALLSHPCLLNHPLL